jgi:hypothetical protein
MLACAAHAQTPEQLARYRSLLAWLAGPAKLEPDSIVRIERWGVLAVTAKASSGPSNMNVTVRAETFPTFQTSPDNPASTESEVQINCPSRRAHTERIQSFTENGRGGSQSTGFGATGWEKPVQGSAMDSIVSAACDPKFQSPMKAFYDPGQAAAPPIQTPLIQPPPATTSAPSPPRRAAVAAPHEPAPPPSGASAQLSATVSEAAAKDLSRALMKTWRSAWPMVSVSVEPGKAGERFPWRVVARGFADAGEAAAYCKQLKAKGQDCFARRAG